MSCDNWLNCTKQYYIDFCPTDKLKVDKFSDFVEFSGLGTGTLSGDRPT